MIERSKDIRAKVIIISIILVLALALGSYNVILANSEQYTFNLYTQDGDNYTPIEGTKFEITDLEGNNIKDVNGNIVGTAENIDGVEHYVLTTDENGKIGANIPKGSYKAIEILSNNAYILNEEENERTYYFNIETETKREYEWIVAHGNAMWSYMKSLAYNENEDIVCVGIISEYNKEITKLDNEGIDLNGDNKIDEVSNGGDDGLIVSYDKNGQFLWSETFGGIYDDSCNKIVRTNDNGYIIVGKISSPIIYLNGEIINELTAKKYDVKGQDGFILKINEKGKYQWAVRIGGNYDDEITSVIETQEGDLILGGNFKSKELNFYEYGGSYIIREKIKNEGEQNSFITSYTAEGKYMWSKKISGNDYMEITNIVEMKNEIAVAINYKGSIETQNIKCESYSSESKNSIIIKMTSNGNIEWGYDIYAIPKNIYMADNHINITGITISMDGNIIIAMNCSGKVFSRNLTIEKEYQNIYTNDKTGICTDIMELSQNGTFYKNIYDLSGRTTEDIRATVVNIIDIKMTHDNKLIIGGYYYSGKDIDVNKDGQMDKTIDFEASSTHTSTGFFEKITLNGDIELADCVFAGDKAMNTSSCIINVSELNNNKINALGWFKRENITTRNFYYKYLEKNPYKVVNAKRMNGIIINENYRREDLEVIIPKEVNVKNYKKTYTIFTKINGIVNEIEKVKHGENSTKNIEIMPDEGYKVSKIMMNNVEYKDFKIDENGKIIIPNLKNITEDIFINVEFVKKIITFDKMPVTGGKNILIMKFISIVLVCIGLCLINYATYRKGER